MSQKPTIFVDVSIIARRDAGTGIQRVVRALWNELATRVVDGFAVVPVAGSAKGRYRRIRADFLDQPIARLPLPIVSARVRPRSGDIFLGLDLSTRVLPRNRRQVAKWKAKGVKIGVIVYDLLPVRHPEWFSTSAQQSYAGWLDSLPGLADHLFCISQTVAGDLRNWLEEAGAARCDRPAIAPIRIGGQIAATRPSTGRPADAAAVLQWVAAAHTVMMVGTIEPRKSHDQALAAFELLWAAEHPRDWHLLVVGRPGWKTEALQDRFGELGAAEARFRWLSDVSDAFLEELYAAVDGVLMASRGEGHGLPLLEAASHRKPVLARDIPIFREVSPAGVQFFAGDSAEALQSALNVWRDQPTIVEGADGPVQWRDAVDDILQALGWSASHKGDQPT